MNSPRAFLEFFRRHSSPSKKPSLPRVKNMVDNNPLLACAIEGLIIVDIEGPIPYNHLPKIIKKLVEHIITKLGKTNSNLIPALSYLYDHLRESLLSASPYEEASRYDMFSRLVIGPPIKHYTSSSCIHLLPDPVKIAFIDSWEISNILPHPIILSCQIDLKFTSFPIISRDLYRDQQYSPILIPSARTEAKVHALFSEEQLALQ